MDQCVCDSAAVTHTAPPAGAAASKEDWTKSPAELWPLDTNQHPGWTKNPTHCRTQPQRWTDPPSPCEGEIWQLFPSCCCQPLEQTSVTEPCRPAVHQICTNIFFCLPDIHAVKQCNFPTEGLVNTPSLLVILSPDRPCLLITHSEI